MSSGIMLSGADTVGAGDKDTDDSSGVAGTEADDSNSVMGAGVKDSFSPVKGAGAMAKASEGGVGAEGIINGAAGSASGWNEIAGVTLSVRSAPSGRALPLSIDPRANVELSAAFRKAIWLSPMVFR